MNRVRDAVAIIAITVMVTACGRPVEPARIELIKREGITCWRVSDWPSGLWNCTGEVS